MSLANFRAAKCHQLRSCGEVQMCSDLAAAWQAFRCRCGRRITLTEKAKMERISWRMFMSNLARYIAHE